MNHPRCHPAFVIADALVDAARVGYISCRDNGGRLRRVLHRRMPFVPLLQGPFTPRDTTDFAPTVGSLGGRVEKLLFLFIAILT